MDYNSIEKTLKDTLDTLESMKALTVDRGVNIQDEIVAIESQLQEILKKTYASIPPMERVRLARKLERPTAFYYIDNLFDDFIELFGDRKGGEDSAIVGGIARFNGRPVTVIGQQKGRDTQENIERNFGMPNPEGYRKSIRLMKQAQKFRRPIVLFVDTPGAFCGIEAENKGQAEAIAKNIQESFFFDVPMITFVIGEGGSGGALALAVADKVYMLENSIYSIISPEGYASILWKDNTQAERAAKMMKLTSYDLFAGGVIDGIIDEPTGGAQENPEQVKALMADVLARSLKELDELGPETLLNLRYHKYRVIGAL